MKLKQTLDLFIDYMYVYTVGSAANGGYWLKTNERGAWRAFGVWFNLHTILSFVCHQHFHNFFTSCWVGSVVISDLGIVWVLCYVDCSFTTFFSRWEIQQALRPELVNYWRDQLEETN